MFPFLSPDGAWIGFTREGSIYKMPAQGGPVVRLASFDRFVFGAAWSTNGTIYFSTLDPGRNRGTLMQVPDSGGEARPLFELAEDERDNDFGFPVLLPGERGLLFLKASLNAGLSPENVVVEHFEFAQSERKVLMEKVTFPRWVNSGHIVAVDAEGSIVAQPFDPATVELNGPAVTLPTQVRLLSGWLPALSVSSGGSLFYVEGQRKVEEELLWMSEDGSTTAAGTDFAPFGDVVLSPDGTKVAYTVVEAQTSTLIVEDLQRRTRTPVDRAGQSPAWTSDSRQLVYAQLLEGDSARGQLLARSADGRGEPRVLAQRPLAPFPLDVSADDSRVLFKERDPSSGALQLWEVPLAGGEPRRVEGASSTVMAAAYSPDGRWLAYQSDREGGFRIYLRSLESGAGADVAISGEGAIWPMWGADSRSLDFVSRDPIRIQRVGLDRNGVSAAARTLLTPADSQAVDLRIYSIADDGRWLVTRRAGGDLADRQVIVLGWDEELRTLAPAN